MMELSINTLVVLILGILVVGGGIAFITSIISETEPLLLDIQEAQKEQLDEKLQRGERVVITDNVKQGNFGDYTFGLGLQNSLPQEREFQVAIIPKTIVESDGAVLYHNTDIDMPEAFYNDEAITLSPGERTTSKVFNINIEKGLPRGTYSYEILIKYKDDDALVPYSDPLQIMITIK